jgi:hypothetical protein
VRALVRRYKYLQVSVEESYTKILKFLTGFREDNVLKLAQSTAFMLAMNLISTKPLANMFELHKMVENGVVLKFVTTLFKTWLQVRSIQQVGAALQKGRLENSLQDFFPPSRRGLDDVIGHFRETPGLGNLAKWYIAQQTVRHRPHRVCMARHRPHPTHLEYQLRRSPPPSGWREAAAVGGRHQEVE